MLQLNDVDHTLIDLTQENLKHIKWNNNYYIKVHYALGDTIIETSFTYETGTKAKADYTMLMETVAKAHPQLLIEKEKKMYESWNLNRWGDDDDE